MALPQTVAAFHALVGAAAVPWSERGKTILMKIRIWTQNHGGFLFFFNWAIFRFHVNFQWCRQKKTTKYFVLNLQSVPVFFSRIFFVFWPWHLGRMRYLPFYQIILVFWVVLFSFIFRFQIIGENDAQFGEYLCRWICALIYYAVVFSTTGPKRDLEIVKFYTDQLDVFFLQWFNFIRIPHSMKYTVDGRNPAPTWDA